MAPAAGGPYSVAFSTPEQPVTRSQMPLRIHALVQDADDGDPVGSLPEIDHVLSDAAPPVAGSDMGAALCQEWRVGEFGAAGFDLVGIAQGLGQAPVLDRPVEQGFEIALCCGGQPIFSHAGQTCVA